MNHILGSYSLWTSTALYVLWFLPQLRLSWKRRSTEGLSLGMHLILYSGYLADLIYGFGLHMPVAYRLVTSIGLASLLFQQSQFLRYGHLSAMQRSLLIIPPIFFVSMYFLIKLSVPFYSQPLFDRIGLFSVLANCLYTVPQIIKNYRINHNPDLSALFMWVALACNALDIVSAYCLNWDYPNKIGAPLGLLLTALLIHSAGILRYHPATLKKAALNK